MRRAAQYVLYATIPVALYLQFTHGPVVWEFVFDDRAGSGDTVEGRADLVQ